MDGVLREAAETITGEVVNVALLALIQCPVAKGDVYAGLDVSEQRDVPSRSTEEGQGATALRAGGYPEFICVLQNETRWPEVLYFRAGPPVARHAERMAKSSFGISRLVGLADVAGELGFEPRQTESESVVLPLHHSPPKCLILQRFFRKLSKIAKEFSKSGVW
jgi:hypothetical protein